MSFQFRLQSILRLRERDRDQAAQAFEQAVRAKQILLERIDEIERNANNYSKNVARPA